LGAHDSSLRALGATKMELLEIRSIEYFMYYEILYFAASATTKVSITLTVLRLCDKQRTYRLLAIGNAVMMIVAAGIAGVFVLTNCRPFAVYWNPNL
jgi:predicted lysophospholipase L1 biosynthesis ABC-type transport system permease subunit